MAKIKKKNELEEVFYSLPVEEDSLYDDLSSGKIKPVAVGIENFEKYLKTRGRPKLANPKERVDIRFDADVLSGLKKHFGRGWSTKVNDIMRGILNGIGAL